MHRLLIVGLALVSLAPALVGGAAAELSAAPSSVEAAEDRHELPAPESADRGSRVAPAPVLRLPASLTYVPVVSAVAEPPKELLRDLRENVRRDTPGRDLPRLTAGEPYH